MVPDLLPFSETIVLHDVLKCCFFLQFLIFIVGHIAGGKWTGLHIGLCAVNLAEASGDSMSMIQLSEIYATSALRLQVNPLWKTLFLSVSI